MRNGSAIIVHRRSHTLTNLNNNKYCPLPDPRGQLKLPGGGGGDSSSASAKEAVKGTTSDPPSVPGTGGFKYESKKHKTKLFFK